MKIIKEPKEFSRTIVCHQVVDEYGRYWNKKEDHCGAELEFDSDDVLYRESYNYWNHSLTEDYGIFCPCCGSFVVIEDLPKWVKEKVKKENLFEEEE